MAINRRKFVKGAILLPVIYRQASPVFSANKKPFIPGGSRRLRPTDAAWPSATAWEQLHKAVNGNLVKLDSPFAACKTSPGSSACIDFFKNLKNPYYIGDNPALTQTLGWLDAWRSEPSVYAISAQTTADVVAAINFARVHNLRLVVKGGAHSYQGTSNSKDSLLIWTRAMKNIVLHDSFVAAGCTGKEAAHPAVTIDAGATWLHAYEAVTVKGGRFVQGGGCTTVGVAGLIQGGGFGSFSKHYGLAAAALMEAEVVTADGNVIIANPCSNPDLFWALKGGGGGSFGVITKLTLKTRELPETFGGVFGIIEATSEKAFTKLINQLINLYHEKLFNPHWGEQIRFKGDNTIEINMLFHGLSRQQAQEAWQSFEAWIKAAPESYSFRMPLTIIEIPAQKFWDFDFLNKNAAAFITPDDRPQARKGDFYWASNKSEAGQFLYSYHSAWLPDALLQEENRQQLANALFSSSRKWSVTLHFNKGLSGAPAEEIAAAKDTAINPDVLQAFALAIIAGEGEPAYAGLAGYEPDLTEGRRQAGRIKMAMEELLKVAPAAGSYLSESDYFEKNWQQSFWGSNYARLLEVKKKYDPDGLFFVRHGVGSETWSDDGFTRLK